MAPTTVTADPRHGTNWVSAQTATGRKATLAGVGADQRRRAPGRGAEDRGARDRRATTGLSSRSTSSGRSSESWQTRRSAGPRARRCPPEAPPGGRAAAAPPAEPVRGRRRRVRDRRDPVAAVPDELGDHAPDPEGHHRSEQRVLGRADDAGHAVPGHPLHDQGSGHRRPELLDHRRERPGDAPIVGEVEPDATEVGAVDQGRRGRLEHDGVAEEGRGRDRLVQRRAPAPPATR